MCFAIFVSCFFLFGYLLHYLYRKPYIDNFREKCVLITGSDSGFGRNLALDLDKLGVKVFAACYTRDGADGLRQEASSRLKILPEFDVTDELSLIAAKAILEEDLLPDEELWGLVNNAGIAQGHFFHLATLQDYKTCLEVNCLGMIRTSEIFMPFIKKSKGRIVNVTSVMGRMTTFSEPYMCSKSALGPYNDGMRRYLKDYQVHVAAIEPGFFRTNITKKGVLLQDTDRSWQSLPQYLRNEYGEEFLQAAKTDLAVFLKYPLLAKWNSLNMVTEAIIHALFAKHPKSRYICGFDARFLYQLGPFIPDWIFDRILRALPRIYKVMARRHPKDQTVQKIDQKH